MSYEIDKYDEHNPQLRLKFEEYEISFSLQSVAPDSHDWLGSVLERQINVLVNKRVANAIEHFQQGLHRLLGLPDTAKQHTDSLALQAFLVAASQKMARGRAKGRYCWDNPNVCSAEDLNRMLVEHLGEGDPMDVALFAFMLWFRGEKTKASDGQEELHFDKEPAAQAVYETFEGAEDHPWVPGGNSNKQDLARKYAHAALSAYGEVS
jgi:hypothetical protein